MKKSDVLTQIRSIGVVPVLRLSSARDLLAMAEALHSAKIVAIEIPMDVPGALAVISDLVHRFDEEVLVGAGTVWTNGGKGNFGAVLDAESASSVVAAGASFITSPSCDPGVVKYCIATDVAVFPGALTPTEITSAWKMGADMVKVFPCSALGGPSYLKAIKAPLRCDAAECSRFHRGRRLCPRCGERSRRHCLVARGANRPHRGTRSTLHRADARRPR